MNVRFYDKKEEAEQACRDRNEQFMRRHGLPTLEVHTARNQHDERKYIVESHCTEYWIGQDDYVWGPRIGPFHLVGGAPCTKKARPARYKPL